MRILAIDLGTYSVKFFEADVDKKKTKLIHIQEVILSKVLERFPQDATLSEIQYGVVANYLAEHKSDSKIIYQINNDMFTSRYITLPVKSKKKADLMIPFQLDDNLPYNVGDSHYVCEYITKKESIDVIINITPKQEFEHVYNFLNGHHILPNQLTSELSCVQNFVQNYEKIGVGLNGGLANFCILDLGHITTKAYFFHGQQLISNHISHVSGKSVDDVISETYQVNIDEAIIYKHDNCFFLNEDQYEQVNADQKEFAKLMAQTFTPLILEIKRWKMGHRMKTGEALETIYITGGTSKIKNISSFLQYNLGVKVEKFNPYKQHKKIMSTLDESERPTHFLSYIMCASGKNKTLPINFLKGKYSANVGGEIPITSSAFLGLRVYILAFILLTAAIVENVLLTKEEKAIDKSLAKIVKSNGKSLGFTRKDKKNLKRNPQAVLKKLKKEYKLAKDEVKLISSASDINALKYLYNLSEAVQSNKKVSLVSFSSSNKSAKASFYAKEIRELEVLKDHLNKTAIGGSEMKLNTKTNRLDIRF